MVSSVQVTGVSLDRDVSFRNVLFVTDFSSTSQLALPYAIALAEKYEGKVYLAHVVTPEMWEFIPPECVADLPQKITAYAQLRMDRLVAGADFQGVPHDTLLKQGDVWDSLREIVDDYAIDAIALGLGGERALQQVLMGSLADKIIRLAHRPVLSVGPRAREIEPNHRPHNILLAIDFSLNCARAIACADSIAEKFAAKLISVHVLVNAPVDPQTKTRLEQFFCQKLQESFPPATCSQSQRECDVEFGTPAEAILKLASARQVDLIVMGARGAGSVLRGTSRFGATAYDVVSEAGCPVLTVRGN